MKKLNTWLVIVALFISGIIIGSVGTGFYMKHRIGGLFHQGLPAVRKVVMKKLTSELNLTQDQQDEASEIVEETQFKLLQLRLQYQPQMEKIIEAGITELKTKLSADQQKKLDALYEKIKKHRNLNRNMQEGK